MVLMEAQQSGGEPWDQEQHRYREEYPANIAVKGGKSVDKKYKNMYNGCEDNPQEIWVLLFLVYNVVWAIEYISNVFYFYLFSYFYFIFSIFQDEGSLPSDPSIIEVTVAETQTSLPGTPRKQGHHDRKVGTDSSESEDMEEGKERKFSGERFKKSLRLSSEQLVSYIPKGVI